MTPSAPRTSKNKPGTSRYIPAPHLPPELVPAYDTMVAVMHGKLSVTAAANELSVARNQFQTSFHKAQRAFIEALPMGRTGRPKMSDGERCARQEIARQRRTIERMKLERAELEARLHAVSELVREEMSRPTRARRTTRSRPRSRRSRASQATSTTTTNSDGDGERARAHALALADQLEVRGCRRSIASRAVDKSPATLRRWRADGVPRRSRRERGRPRCDRRARRAVERLVRKSHGRFGCEAIRRRVGNVSRRDVAAIKARTRTKMERERKAAATRVVVKYPGIIRGFDAVHLATHDGVAFALHAQDAAIPFTTSLRVVGSYDHRTVRRSLERDFEEHGAPYVLRLDRASMHRHDAVAKMLDASGVLVLHGPAYYPRFYGQLERKHVDLREFAPAGARRTIREHVSAMNEARVLLNREWCRRSLAYNTAEMLWNRRQTPELDRRELRERVLEIDRRIRGTERNLSGDDSWRFAVQAVLRQQKFLQLVPGGYR